MRDEVVQILIYFALWAGAIVNLIDSFNSSPEASSVTMLKYSMHTIPY